MSVQPVVNDQIRQTNAPNPISTFVGSNTHHSLPEGLFYGETHGLDKGYSLNPEDKLVVEFGPDYS